MNDGRTYDRIAGLLDALDNPELKQRPTSPWIHIDVFDTVRLKFTFMHGGDVLVHSNASGTRKEWYLTMDHAKAIYALYLTGVSMEKRRMKSLLGLD